MSIYSDPYPARGVDECPSVSVAERVMTFAAKTDGPEVLGEFLTSVVVRPPEECDDGSLHIQTRVGIRWLRKPIGELWRRMSDEAKARFLLEQLRDAVRYAATAYVLLAPLIATQELFTAAIHGMTGWVSVATWENLKKEEALKRKKV
jgi:hypothetical protein